MRGDDAERGRALFAISVAAELTGVNPQTLRGYESKGLIDPYRTEGGTRRYSHRDIDRIKEVTALLATGINLAGIARVLELSAETQRLRAELLRAGQRHASVPD